jgi:hypothetical protein
MARVAQQPHQPVPACGHWPGFGPIVSSVGISVWPVERRDRNLFGDGAVPVGLFFGSALRALFADFAMTFTAVSSRQLKLN